MKLFFGSLLLATIASKVNGEGILWALFCEHQDNVQWERGSGVAPCYDIDPEDLTGDDPCELFDYYIHDDSNVQDGDGNGYSSEWTDFTEVAVYFVSCSGSNDERAGLCRYDSGDDEWYRDDECKSDGHEAILVKVEDDQRRRLRSNPSAKMMAMAEGMRMLGNGNGKTPRGQAKKEGGNGGNSDKTPPGIFKKLEKTDERATTAKIGDKTYRIFPGV